MRRDMLRTPRRKRGEKRVTSPAQANAGGEITLNGTTLATALQMPLTQRHIGNCHNMFYENYLRSLEPACLSRCLFSERPIAGRNVVPRALNEYAERTILRPLKGAVL
jgi:hypothetical protein